MKNRIKEFRQAHGLTMQGLADELGVTKTSVSKWEKGISFPQADKWEQLANYFHVDISYLMGQGISQDDLLDVLRGAYIQTISKKNFNDEEYKNGLKTDYVLNLGEIVATYIGEKDTLTTSLLNDSQKSNSPQNKFFSLAAVEFEYYDNLLIKFIPLVSDYSFLSSVKVKYVDLLFNTKFIKLVFEKLTTNAIYTKLVSDDPQKMKQIQEYVNFFDDVTSEVSDKKKLDINELREKLSDVLNASFKEDDSNFKKSIVDLKKYLNDYY